jgi:hypothetical protein
VGGACSNRSRIEIFLLNFSRKSQGKRQLEDYYLLTFSHDSELSIM